MEALLEYKCPCCNGAIGFDPDAQKLKCPYCDTEFEAETLQHYDSALQDDTPDDLHWDCAPNGQWAEGEDADLAVYSCRSCGGEIVGDANTAATSCPFCGNPVVILGRLAGSLRPDYVIPFKLDKEDAKAALIRHLSGKPLLPKAFKDKNRIEEIKGVYVPFWLFDTEVDATMRYRATRNRFWSDSNYNYTETRHYLVMRGGTLGFSRIPVDGSSKMPDDLMESIEPFDFSDAVDFQTAYLAGYLADKYDVTAEDCIQRANDRVRTSTEQAFAETVIGYSSVLPQGGNIQLSNGKAVYALYPVWLLNSTYEGKQYTFAMNGQTGKFVGDLPVDKAAARKWLLGLTGAIGLASFIIAYLAWLL